MTEKSGGFELPKDFFPKETEPKLPENYTSVGGFRLTSPTTKDKEGNPKELKFIGAEDLPTELVIFLLASLEKQR